MEALGLVQFEAMAAWMNIKTLLLLAETLESDALRTWVRVAQRTLVPHLELVLVEGVDSTEKVTGACSCLVNMGGAPPLLDRS